ncbi:hypothetical protein GF325_13140 [Candidatus Bathyarchaeota archaeon]|nr:hypothetical protein [Candidatus Bathyarchaeota archaeon]
MAQPDDLTHKMEKAIEAAEAAEHFENSGNFDQAILKYKEAAHLLSQSGFPHDKIEQIYDRIAELEELDRQKSLQQAVQREQALEDSEAEAFDLIDSAEVAIASGEIEKAIGFYEEAVPKLAMVGYSTDFIKEKIDDLKRKVKPATITKGVTKPVAISSPEAKPMKPIRPSQRKAPVKPAGVTPPKPVMDSMEKPAPVQPSPDKQPELESKVEKIDAFKTSRNKVEELEDRAFKLIDEAKVLTENEEYREALSTYTIVKNLLRNAGWDEEQIEPILIQEKLVQEIIEEKVKKATAPVDAITSELPAGADVPTMVRQKLDLYLDQDARMREYKKKQLSRQETEAKAFDLIDEAKRLYEFRDIDKDYLGAIKLYQQALQILQRMGWSEQVGYIQEEVTRLRQLHANKVQLQTIEKEEKARAKQLVEQQKFKEEQRKKTMEGDIVSISSILETIDEKEKEKKKEAEEQSIKQKLLQEKRMKTIVAKKSGGKSLDSLKDLLFGDHDAKKREAEIAKKLKEEEDFLRRTSKKFFDMKKELSKKKKSSDDNVEEIVDIVHEEVMKRSKPKETSPVHVMDLRKKQEMEMAAEKKEREDAVSDVMGILENLKEKEPQGASKNDRGERKEKGIQDEELKSMLEDLEKKNKQ